MPRFYLKGFASSPQRINIYNLTRMQAIHDAGLGAQCYRPHFYGKHGDLENAFAELENRSARVLKEVMRTGQPPQPGTRGHRAIAAFVALQKLRTVAAMEKIKHTMAMMLEDVGEMAAGQFLVSTDLQALTLSLRSNHKMAALLGNLKLGAVQCAPGGSFITSDNPACPINPYCSEFPDYGVVGADSRGLVIVLPLSPTILLLLFDADVYRLRNNPSTRGPVASLADVRQLNLTQVPYADANIYFSHWATADDVSAIASERNAVRPRVRMGVAVNDSDPSQQILHTYNEQPRMNIALTFLQVRSGAARVPVVDRIHQFRSGPSSRPLLTRETGGPTDTVRFTIKDRR